MNDPRADAVVAAVAARFPESRISFVPPTDPDELQIPDLLIVVDVEGSEDAAFDRRREIETFAVAATRAAYTDVPMPWWVIVLAPTQAEEYLKGPPWLRVEAKA